jgi:hypothetical protein
MQTRNQRLFEVPFRSQPARRKPGRLNRRAVVQPFAASYGFQSNLFQGNSDLLAVLQGRLRLGRVGDSQYPAPIKSQGSAVAKVQTALVELGYLLPTHGIDGKYGNETYNAVLQYKRRHNIRTDTGYLDGILGSKTIQHLDAALAQKTGQKTTVLVNVRDNLGRPISSPAVIVRLRDPQTSKILGEQRALSSTLTFALNRSTQSAQQAFLVETQGDPRFWPWKGINKPTGPRYSIVQQPTTGNNVQAIVPRLRDITESKENLIDVGMQTGNAPPPADEISCGSQPGMVPFPLPLVLNVDPKACGAKRLLTEQRLVPKKLHGSLRILCATPETANTDPPGLFLIWVPDKLDIRQFDFHVYFHPTIGDDVPLDLNCSEGKDRNNSNGKNRDNRCKTFKFCKTSSVFSYPLGCRVIELRDKDGNPIKKEEQPYVGKGYSHLMWRSWGHYQHHLAKKSCIYVVPVGSRKDQFNKLTAAKLMGWLQEIAAIVVQNRVPGPHQTSPAVGKVALSGFSYGGHWVAHVLRNPGNQTGQNFLDQNVGELYFFDIPGSLAAQDVTPTVRAWQQRQGSRRVIRSYTRFGATHQAFASLIQTPGFDVRNARFREATAQELHTPKGTSVFIPDSLLSNNCGKEEHKSACAIPIAGFDNHSWPMRFFMTHALAASWFEPIL